MKDSQRYIYLTFLIWAIISIFIITFLGCKLSVANDELDSTIHELNSTTEELKDAETSLEYTQKKLGRAEEDLSDAIEELEDTSNKLISTVEQLEVEKSENIRILSSYSGIREQVNARMGLNQHDRQSFITPDNLLVEEKVQNITGGFSEDVDEYWMDFKRLYDWVVGNIDYSYDSYVPYLPTDISGELTWISSYWRTPEETILDETGDCEDMATLLASMMINYCEGKYAIWCIEIFSSVPISIGHLAVAFPVEGGKLTILDPAGSYYTRNEYGTLGSLDYSIAIKQWLSHWDNKMPDAEIVEVLSDKEYQEFSNTEEFIKWLQER